MKNEDGEPKSNKESVFAATQEDLSAQPALSTDRLRTQLHVELPVPANTTLSHPHLSSTGSEAPKATNIDEISNEIFYLEREIADLTRQYKDLLAQSQSSSNATTLSNMRADLSNIARLLEEKSERLFELKKQQQLALRAP